jgi:hypothetical protein
VATFRTTSALFGLVGLFASIAWAPAATAERPQTAELLIGRLLTASNQAGLDTGILDLVVDAEQPGTASTVTMTVAEAVARIAGRTLLDFRSGDVMASPELGAGNVQHAYLQVRGYATALTTEPTQAPSGGRNLLAYTISELTPTLHTPTVKLPAWLGRDEPLAAHWGGGVLQVDARDYAHGRNEIDWGVGFHGVGSTTAGSNIVTSLRDQSGATDGPWPLWLPLVNNQRVLDDASLQFTGFASIMQGVGCAPVPVDLPFIGRHYLGNLCVAFGLLLGDGVSTFSAAS